MSQIIASSSRRRDDQSSQVDCSSIQEADDEKALKSDVHVSICKEIPELGDPAEEQRFWFQRSKNYNPNAIATQPSVFDDPDLAEEYKPHPSWENLHRFDPSARWTWAEEYKVVRKIDMRILGFAILLLIAMEFDRSNIQQANADNFLAELHLTRDDYNLGNTIFKLCYLSADLPSQLFCKWLGVDRFLPMQMTAWAIVASCQFWLSGRTSFLACRALLGIFQGGFTPAIILYFSYFYKHHELSIRLGLWYSAISVADIIAGILAFGIFHLNDMVPGISGWRWLFLCEGIFTLLIGLVAFILIPPSPTQTANWARGKKGWFTEREEIIMVNRVIREDPSKGTMHNREAITFSLLRKSLFDFDLWPLYIIGLVFQMPYWTLSPYFTLLMKDFGFSTYQVILLAMPYSGINLVTRLGITYASEIFNSLAVMCIFAQLWTLPFLIYMNVVDFSNVNKWVAWTVLTLVLGFPQTHPIHAGWTSRNSNSVRSRAVAAALYNMFVQGGGMIGSNVYQDSDAPRYVVGNRVLLIIICVNILVYSLTKLYYILRNRHRDRKWFTMTEDQRMEYVATTTTEGNKRLDFRFSH
ncbi:hypothetical protein ASPZODRAFT_59291 [Penicilliopsis zonata CBS 506.65]|uniref:Major facilitator superfamily (MFS) profile domain-containing protein n=1 Tax=Penicilliopsis zonata CBS 506.65 TaxID=1073090 RepID=A0A1L9SS73_9EURO|nr:hypothetical protein ASPZODRAFT_59291 [Penicilliopsis zonata CBS 506.65]OJJ49947.1 hypothetical protein ASPZODRAFT_59291 [Penicilliopsis zonata CBS 506.65]